MNAPSTTSFHGGLVLPEHKDASTRRPIQRSALPERLILPLQQHTGTCAQARVKPGQRVLKNTCLADADALLSAPLHAPTSGVVRGIEVRPIPHPGGLKAPCIILEPDGEDEALAPFRCPDPLTRDPGVVADCIRKAGIVGLGGAVFPTHAKIHGATDDPCLHTLVINGAECEPYITCDDLLMREFAHHIVSGIHILLHTISASKALIGIEANKPEAIAAMQAATDAAHLGSLLEIVTVPTMYPSGGEYQLIKRLTGEEVPAGGRPPDIGIVCVNVGTAAAVHQALREGTPLTHRVVTLTGSGLRDPMNLLAPIGAPIVDLIRTAGGYAGPVARLIMGGPMMGVTLPSDEMPLVKSGNCIIAAGPRELAQSGPAMPCIRCGDCASVCPMELLPQQLFWFAQAKDFKKAEDHQLFNCIECGACAYVCPSHIPLVDYYRYAKSEIRAAQQAADKADKARRRFEARNLRLQREKIEKAAQRQAARKKDDRQAKIAAAVARTKTKKAAHSSTRHYSGVHPDGIRYPQC